MHQSPFEEVLQQTLGFEPAAIAVMGKWEPFMRAERCLEEVAARGAAAVALTEALSQPPAPYLLSAEAWLRGQPRPGCVMAAEILARLGADPARIRCCPGANQTWSELQVLDHMRGRLGADNLLLLTAGYHVQRTRDLIRDLGSRLSDRPLAVHSVDGDLVRDALSRLDPTRAFELRRVIERGLRGGFSLAPAAVNEIVARLGRRFPAIQGLVAALIRGRPSSASPPMFQPDLSDSGRGPGGEDPPT